MDQQTDQTTYIELAAEIVSAYVGNNNVQRVDLPGLIGDIYKALATAAAPAPSEPASDQRRLTPQEIKRSIKPETIVSFEDGKNYKTLRRHLAVRGLTPQAYREKWGLPADYPMVAPSYSTQRSEMARSLGLGRKRREELSEAPVPDAADASDAPAARSAPKQAAAPGATKRATKGAAEASDATRGGGTSKRAAAPRGKKRTDEPAAA